MKIKAVPKMTKFHNFFKHITVENSNSRAHFRFYVSTDHNFKKVKQKFKTIFSSPEHEVLMVSYCDQSMSFVRRSSSTICFKS